MAATPDGSGYWLVASDGGIFSFGDAAFYGSGTQLGRHVFGMSLADSGAGYILGTSSGPVGFGNTVPGPSQSQEKLGAGNGSLVEPIKVDDAASPSGEGLPTVAPPGMHEVFSDDFTGSSLDNKWFSYNGPVREYLADKWSSSQVAVRDGQLILSASRIGTGNADWVSGGVSSRPGLSDLTYGAFFLRMKATAAEGVADVGLLWPVQNYGPFEIDFVEDGGGAKTMATATLHYDNSKNVPQKTYQRLAVDLTQWHTWGVIVTPHTLTYYLDGVAWATQTSNNIPTIPMTFAIQTQAWVCGFDTYETCPNSSTPNVANLDVDWAVAYGFNSPPS
jgi:beta-glucanase (GH16 family)